MSKKDDLADSLAEQKRNKPRLYNEAANELRAAQISSDVALKHRLLDQAEKKVKFSDLGDVKRRVGSYLTACQEAAAIPTMSGLALSFGVTRQAIYKFVNEHKESASAEYLETVRELMADCLVSAGLGKSTDAAVTIFILKNHHNYADRVEIAPVKEDFGPLGPLENPEELRRRIEANVVDDYLEDDE